MSQPDIEDVALQTENIAYEKKERKKRLVKKEIGAFKKLKEGESSTTGDSEEGHAW